MKKLLIAIALFVGTISTQAQEIKWVSLNEALELQKKAPKKIIMDVYTKWCGPCKMLEKKTFKNKDVVNYINKHYYAVKFNGEGNQQVNFKGKKYGNANYDEKRKNSRNSSHDFARYMRISAYPTLVFFDEKGDFITPVPGYQTPQQIEMYLKMFVADKHKEMTSQEKFNKYYQAFKPTFRGK